MTMTEDWTKEWERRVVNGVYPLRRFLGRSNHSVVFLTECKAQNVAEAAIKIMPAYPALTEAQLSYWRRVATLSHPHLIRLFDAGRCQLGGHKFLFVVTDLAEQNLAQILPGRALTADEVRDLLPPTLDALAYLHGKNLVQGGLKPSNFLVIGDQLKLASDTIRPAGEPVASIVKPSMYDPPEAKKGRMSTAGDIWALGITLVEALTQTAPAWSGAESEPPSLPAAVPFAYAETVRRCLSRIPADRPTITELEAQFKPAPRATLESVAPPAAEDPLVRAASLQRPPKTRLLFTAMAVGVMVVWAVWAGVHLFHRHTTNGEQPAVIAPAPPSQAPAAAPPVAADNPRTSSAAKPNGAPLPAVLHQENPDISRSARESIRGVIKVAVRATIDRSGNVVAAILDNRGSSRYFARAATEAAKRWKFAPASDQALRVWLIQFEFTRSGITAHAAALR